MQCLFFLLIEHLYETESSEACSNGSPTQLEGCQFFQEATSSQSSMDLYENNPSFWEYCGDEDEDNEDEPMQCESGHDQHRYHNEEELEEINVSNYSQEAEDIYSNVFHHMDMSAKFEHLTNPVQTDTNEDKYTQPIHDHTNVSCQEALLVLMAIKLRHKLSNLAVEDIISFCNLILPTNHSFVKDAAAFNNFFQQLKHPVTKHFYCPNKKCQMYLGTSFPSPSHQETKCSQCGFRLSSNHFFIEIPLENQLQTLLSSKYSMLDCILYIIERLVHKNA